MPDLECLKRELERFGEENDRTHAERAQRMLNITRDTGEFLAVLVRAMDARRILEIGTSNGYSTLWLAEAARALGGRVETVERDAGKIELATATLVRAGLSDVVQLRHAEAERVLGSVTETSCDLIFLDAQRTAYVDWWPALRRALRPGGLLVVDNAVSHRQELSAFTALVESDEAFVTSLVPVGKGEFLAVRASAA
ncbi:class I SAM-dependent methyltransferase [Halomonas sp. HP20-15]|uniref:O-methyltransferase n=1 Tax=Halomonas sp. HP20-15 TaxID=3085901 RepID=UPI002981411A|nr:class I SAM-dependent methyltransferase [Halomonas sp. HP20-15]MDW5375794.1 class I SAM-dependent methyltransferase [Halomonas sp. HP20-15]